jgi:hypothetical protein
MPETHEDDMTEQEEEEGDFIEGGEVVEDLEGQEGKSGVAS